MIRIIDFKKIDITDDEWNQYQDICNSYNRPNFKGTDLFKGLFETDEKGIIVLLKPPVHYTSMEVYLFIMSLMQQQHLRLMYVRLEQAINDTKQVTEDARKTLEELKNSRGQEG